MNTRTRVLIVDDERAVRTALELAMPEHFEVRSVDSAEAALTVLQSWCADLMLVDKNLPGMSGLELLRRVKAQFASPPWALLMTGFASVQSALESLDIRVYGYIEKPFRDIFGVVQQLERLANLKGSLDRLNTRKEPDRHREAIARAIVLTRPDADSELIVAGLAAHGTSATVTHSLEDAARIAGSDGISLFVIDGQMESGLLDIITRIREVCPTGRFIVAHEKPSLRLITQLIQLGVVRGVLELPLSRDTVVHRMGGILEAIRADPLRVSEVA